MEVTYDTSENIKSTFTLMTQIENSKKIFQERGRITENLFS